jgi:hypothetical protein
VGTLHNKELHNLYFSPDIVEIIRLGLRRWSGLVALMGERKGAYKVLLENLKKESTRKTL